MSKGDLNLIRYVYKQVMGEVWMSSLDMGDYLVISPRDEQIDLITKPNLGKLRNRLGGRGVRVLSPGSIRNQRPLLLITYAPRKKVDLESRPLNLLEQLTPTAIPIGVTSKGSLWIDLVEGDSYLIGGPRGMGKTTLLHGWIQALLHGGSAKLYLWDGKYGTEFKRYNTGATYSDDLDQVLQTIRQETEERRRLLTQYQLPSAAHWNKSGRTPEMVPLVLIIDEAAFIPQECQPEVMSLVGRGRAWGAISILATQRTGSTEVQPYTRSNLVTRVAFPVLTHHDSQMILGFAGAEKLPKVKGRLLMVWGGRRVTAQAFSVPDDTGSLYPEGAEAVLFREAIEQEGGKITQKFLQDHRIKTWKAHKLLQTWKEKGWVEKDPEKNNAHTITPQVVEWLGRNDA